jgi:hypothetical protein
MSLDGYIAGLKGEYDWIVMDPEIDFAGLMAQFDTFLIGRKTFEVMRMGSDVKSTPGIQNIVFSRTLRPSDYPHVTVNSDAVSEPACGRLGGSSRGVAHSSPAWRRRSAAPFACRTRDAQAAKTAPVREDRHHRG